MFDDSFFSFFSDVRAWSLITVETGDIFRARGQSSSPRFKIIKIGEFNFFFFYLDDSQSIEWKEKKKEWMMDEVRKKKNMVFKISRWSSWHKKLVLRLCNKRLTHIITGLNLKFTIYLSLSLVRKEVIGKTFWMVKWKKMAGLSWNLKLSKIVFSRLPFFIPVKTFLKRY